MILLKRLLVYSILFSLIVTLYSCGSEEASEKTEEEDYTNVEVALLEGKKFIDYITVVGTVKPFNKAELAEESGGIIERYFVEKGDFVNKGDTIVMFDNAVTKANLDAAEAQYKLAEVNFEKQEKVYNDNVISDFEYLTAKYNRDQAKASYEQIKARYDRTFVTAPFAGVVDEKNYEEGELVPPASAVVNLINSSRLKIVAGVPERYAGSVDIGTPVEIYINEVQDEPLEGKISFVGQALSPGNRTFPVEVVVPNKNGLIKPEMVAEVKIQRGVYDNILIIPEEVVTRTDSGYVVYVEEQGKARQRMINIINRKADYVAVNNGIKPNEKLITLGFQNLIDGENVKIVNEVN